MRAQIQLILLMPFSHTIFFSQNAPLNLSLPECQTIRLHMGFILLP